MLAQRQGGHLNKQSIFLTTKETVRAICNDFKAYDPQIMLFTEVLRIVFDGNVHLKREPGKVGAWISQSGQTNMKWLEGTELVTYMCHAMSRTRWDADLLTAVGQRVFQTRVEPAEDQNSGHSGVRIETNIEAYDCQQCGHCCRNLEYHREVKESDLSLWKKMGRKDILQWVDAAPQKNGVPAYRIWVCPKTKRIVEPCPFLEKNPTANRWICRIHDVKPDICRQYPVSRKHAVMTGCKGFSLSGANRSKT